MNLRKFERIAEQLEKSLGIETDNGLLDNAEGAADAGADLLPDAIDENIEKEKQNADIQPSPLEADDEEVQALTTEINDTEDAIDDIEQTDELNDDIADLEQQLDDAEEAPEAPAVDDGEDNGADDDDWEDDDDDAEAEGDSDKADGNDDGIELEKDEAKACIASMKRLLRIAKAVKMSKDMPACKKEEVLSKIQKASDKLRKGALGGAPATVEDDEVSTEDHPSVSSFVQIFNTKRGKLNSIMKGRGKGNVRIRTLLGNGVDNKIIGNMTVSELFRTFSSVLSALK